MDEELSRLLNQGLALYAGGHAFEAHEVWEYAWKAEVGRTKQLLRVLIQIAAAVHKNEIGTHAGTCKILAKAQEHLSEMMPGGKTWLGFDLEHLGVEMERAQKSADAIALGRTVEFHRPALPRVVGDAQAFDAEEVLANLESIIDESA